MKTITNTFRVTINAKPESDFVSVSDVTRHDEWNSGLKTEAVTTGPVTEVASIARRAQGANKRARPTNYG